MKIEMSIGEDYKTRRELRAFSKRLSDAGIGHAVDHIGKPKETVIVHVFKRDIHKIIELL